MFQLELKYVGSVCLVAYNNAAIVTHLPFQRQYKHS